MGIPFGGVRRDMVGGFVWDEAVYFGIHLNPISSDASFWEGF